MNEISDTFFYTYKLTLVLIKVSTYDSCNKI